jgi:hypothetical protein
VEERQDFVVRSVDIMKPYECEVGRFEKRELVKPVNEPAYIASPINNRPTSIVGVPASIGCASHE